MSEIAKCPVCGRMPRIKVFKPSYEFGGSGNDVITIECCGMESSFIKLWNQYAAAMELAKTTSEYRDYECIDALMPVVKRAIESFGGE